MYVIIGQYIKYYDNINKLININKKLNKNSMPNSE